MVNFTASICTLSWIDKGTGLPEHDGDGPPLVIPGYQITKEDDTLPFRFVNLLEATITATGQRISAASFTSASGIYQNPSFGRIRSEAFATLRSVMQRPDRVIFQQTAGARTVSPETIAEIAGTGGSIITGIPFGKQIARRVAHDFFGFPPIWTTLELTVFADGSTQGALLNHSLFPSVSYYEMATASAAAAASQGGNRNLSRNVSSYRRAREAFDALPNLERWKTEG